MPDKKSPQPADRTVDVVESSYQPSKAELEEDVSINASPEEVARALVQTVNVQRVKTASIKPGKSSKK